MKRLSMYQFLVVKSEQLFDQSFKLHQELGVQVQGSFH